MHCIFINNYSNKIKSIINKIVNKQKYALYSFDVKIKKSKILNIYKLKNIEYFRFN